MESMEKTQKLSSRILYVSLNFAIVMLILLVTGCQSIEILNAAKQGNLEKTKSLLAKNPELVSTKDFFHHNWTPLCWAAEKGHTEVAKLLIDSGANVNAKGKQGPPLYRAAVNGHKDIVELLVSNDADVNAPYYTTKATALHGAAALGHIDIVVFLISNSANVNARDYEGNTPLEWAIYHKRTEVIELLRNKYGAVR